MSFAAAVDHLHALGLELAQDAASPAPRRKFDLAHMRTLAAALGNPHQQFPAVLIAGTNGKGSTAATLASILAAAGLRTGLYTSPHLERVTERIRISTPRTASREPRPCFAEISESDFARLYFHVDETARRLVSTGQLPHHPSYFETLTALAFLSFADPAADSDTQPAGSRPVDIAVLEVGMGGRLDATNIVEPVVSVITDIALDHQEWLGHTIAEIAREKAGILRPGGTLITLPQHPEANQAIGEAALALGVRAVSAAGYLPGREALAEDAGSAWGFRPAKSGCEEGGAFAPETIPSNLEPQVSKLTAILRPNHYDLHIDGETLHVRSPLAGRHQQRNLALAIAAAFELRNHFSDKNAEKPPNRNPTSYISPGHPQNTGNRPLSPANLEPRALSLAAIEAGIAATCWPGRLEFLPPNLLLDVAHNPAGAWALRAALAALPEDLPRTLIFSCLRDKNLAEMAQILFPLFDPPVSSGLEAGRSSLILAPIDSPRAVPIADLLAAAAALEVPARAAAGPADALAMARSGTPPGGLIVATGSIYLIGAIREAALRAQLP